MEQNPLCFVWFYFTLLPKILQSLKAHRFCVETEYDVFDNCLGFFAGSATTPQWHCITALICLKCQYYCFQLVIVTNNFLSNCNSYQVQRLLLYIPWWRHHRNYYINFCTQLSTHDIYIHIYLYVYEVVRKKVRYIFTTCWNKTLKQHFFKGKIQRDIASTKFATIIKIFLWDTNANVCQNQFYWNKSRKVSF